MRKNWSLLILGVLIVGFSSCSKDGSLKSGAAELVPESSTAVVAFDLGTMMEKADMDAIKKMDFYKDAIAQAAQESGEVAAKVLENPESSGIDLSKKAYFFANIQDEEDGLLGFVFNVNDAQKLEDLILEGEGEVEEIKGVSYLTGNDDFTIAWKGDKGFMGVVLKKNRTNLQESVIDIFNNNASISGNSKAVKALSQKGDINYYFTTDVLTKIFKEQLAMSEVFLGTEYFKDIHFWGSTEFLKGEIESTSSAKLSKELNADLKMIFADGSDTDFSRYIPKENLMMSMTGKLNAKGINQLLKDKNLNGLLNVRLNSVGLSADDVAKAIDGDMVLAVNNNGEEEEPSVLFAIKIGDRKLLNNILSKGETLGMLSKKDDNTYQFGGYGNPDGQIIIKDKLMFFSNDMTLLSKLEKGKLDKSECIDKKTYAAIEGVLGFYVDYESVFAMTEQFGRGNEFAYSSMKEAYAKFDWGESTSTVTMKDDSKNALALIFEGANEQYKSMKEEEEEWERAWKEMEKEELELQGLEYEEEEEEEVVEM